MTAAIVATFLLTTWAAYALGRLRGRQLADDAARKRARFLAGEWEA